MASTVTTGDLRYRFDDSGSPIVIELLPSLNDIPLGDVDEIGSHILSRLQTRDAPALVVDLSALKYIGSSLLGLVVRIWKGVTANNGRMVVVNQDPMVLEVLQLAGLHKLWTIVESHEDAEGVLRKRHTTTTSVNTAGYTRVREDAFSVFEMLGLLAAILAAAGTFQTWRPFLELDPWIGPAVQNLGSAAGLILGVVSFQRDGTLNRVTGAFVVLICLATIVAELLPSPF